MQLELSWFIQEGHPVATYSLLQPQAIAYYSRKFAPAEKNFTTGEQELLAKHDALLQWRCC